MLKIVRHIFFRYFNRMQDLKSSKHLVICINSAKCWAKSTLSVIIIIIWIMACMYGPRSTAETGSCFVVVKIIWKLCETISMPPSLQTVDALWCLFVYFRYEQAIANDSVNSLTLPKAANQMEKKRQTQALLTWNITLINWDFY